MSCVACTNKYSLRVIFQKQHSLPVSQKVGCRSRASALHGLTRAFAASPPVLVSSFDVSLQKMFSVRLQIPEQSGHLDCLPLNTTISDQRSLRVVRSGKLIGDGRATASEALHRLRASVSENKGCEYQCLHQALYAAYCGKH